VTFIIFIKKFAKDKNEILTQRRVSDILAEFDMLGIINARVISKEDREEQEK
jgi:Cdc6-like AAA superfamily ATPase